MDRPRVASSCWVLSPPREGRAADGFVPGGVGGSSLSPALLGPQAAWRPSAAIPRRREHRPGICRQEKRHVAPKPKDCSSLQSSGLPALRGWPTREDGGRAAPLGPEDTPPPPLGQRRALNRHSVPEPGCVSTLGPHPPQDAGEHPGLHLHPQGPQRRSWPHPHTTAFRAGPRDDTPGPAGGQCKGSGGRVRGLDQAPGERKGPVLRTLSSRTVYQQGCGGLVAVGGALLLWPRAGQRLRSGRGRTRLTVALEPSPRPTRTRGATCRGPRSRPGPGRPAPLTAPLARPRRTHPASAPRVPPSPRHAPPPTCPGPAGGRPERSGLPPGVQWG